MYNFNQIINQIINYPNFNLNYLIYNFNQFINQIINQFINYSNFN